MMKTPKLLIILSAFLFSCADEPDFEPASATLSIPAESVLNSRQLGRILFYDPRLSVNNSVSCASCHKQQFAFADNVAFSRGFENRLTSRNSMPIQNLGFSRIEVQFFTEDGFQKEDSEVLFWDGRESSLERMVLKPVVNHREMGITDLDGLTEKLEGIEDYRIAFKNIYGDEEIELSEIGNALASFLRRINSHNTRFDNLSSRAKFSAQEQEGLELFMNKYNCNSCHQIQSPNGYLFAGGFANIGLDPVSEDEGLGGTTGNPLDNGKFKIPSLRNVALTAPYMHDGRFETLEEVIDHYSVGMSNNENLDTRLKDEHGNPMVLNISEREKKAIIDFLHTLTDFDMITNPELSNPFKRADK